MLTSIIGSSAGTGIGMAIGGIAAVLVISAIFYVVGRGEDREREQATQSRSPAADEEAEEPASSPRPRVPRSARGRRRR